MKVGFYIEEETGFWCLNASEFYDALFPFYSFLALGFDKLN